MLAEVPGQVKGLLLVEFVIRKKQRSLEAFRIFRLSGQLFKCLIDGGKQAFFVFKREVARFAELLLMYTTR